MASLVLVCKTTSKMAHITAFIATVIFCWADPYREESCLHTVDMICCCCLVSYVALHAAFSDCRLYCAFSVVLCITLFMDSGEFLLNADYLSPILTTSAHSNYLLRSQFSCSALLRSCDDVHYFPLYFFTDLCKLTVRRKLTWFWCKTGPICHLLYVLCLS